ncbi:MAG: hybrid sensor histidine kinase/response regulator [Planctomycetes bacterium]|nr:hybrid sensor histidine kinase/response regulator [Planctomycetota bacterium]
MRAPTIDGAVQVLRRQEVPDLVVLDLDHDGRTNVESIRALLEAVPDLTIVALTPTADENVVRGAIANGAHEYLVKGEYDDVTLSKTVACAKERQRVLRKIKDNKQQELDLKDRFLSHVSHELRTPLNAMFQFIQILLDEIGGPVSDDQREYLTIAMRNALQLERMIGDLMEVSRLSSEKLVIRPEILDLRMLLEEALEGLSAVAGQSRVELVSYLPSGLDYVLADASRTVQVVTNLVENAVKFSPPDGRVVVSAKELDGFVEISVEDEGPGIDQDLADRLFDRLWQDESRHKTSRKGLGLGLYIARQIVERQGGTIYAERGADVGSRFAFTIPTYSIGKLAMSVMKGVERGKRLAILSFVVVGHPDSSRESRCRALRQVHGVVTDNLRGMTDVIATPTDSSSSVAVVHAFGPVDQGCTACLALRVEGAIEAACDLWRDEFEVHVSHDEVELGSDDVLAESEILEKRIDEAVRQIQESTQRAGACSSGCATGCSAKDYQ